MTSTATTTPLVSILIRSMDRPVLERALRSAAAQTWRHLEIVVVAACGRTHRALPAEFQGRPLRLVLPDEDLRLARPDAANACLQAARGEWLNFLDDDDELLPHHLTSLLTAPRPQNERVIISRTRVLDAQGRELGLVSHAGNHVQLYFQSRATTCATLFQRSLVEEGARFDSAFAVHEDHDFQVNCATRTAFRFVDLPTCIWHAQAGESGCGFGANDDPARREAAVQNIRAKWAAAFAQWLGDAAAVEYAGQAYLRNGEGALALACLQQLKHLQPDGAATAKLAAEIDARQAKSRGAPAATVEPAQAPPQVSILIRSMDRPSLARALDSAAAQTWPNLEIVVAAACGSAHRALPEHWKGRPLRLIFPEPDRHLPRPDAANLCLDAARGEWLNFLDDDDELLPEHVATLLTAPRKPGARVLYSSARVHDENGLLIGHSGSVGFPLQFYYQNRSHPAATLFHRSLLDEGARFDCEFVVYEDHDFFIQCATRTEFQFVDAATCIWNAAIGESGAGHRHNSNEAERQNYLAKLRRKWAWFLEPLLREPDALLFVGQQYLKARELPKAIDCLERALAAKPGDINALNLAGVANLHGGHFDRAQVLLTQALERLPDHPGLRRNFDLLQRRRREQAAPNQ